VGQNDRNMMLHYFRGGNDGNLLLYLTSEKAFEISGGVAVALLPCAV